MSIALILAVTASMWLRVTPADSLREGFCIFQAEGQTRYVVPVTSHEAADSVDTYHRLHHHGVALENRRMAYRIYFDKKQTIDPYCKRRPQMELAQSHWYPDETQLAAGFGDDILRVSGTIGVGTLKPYDARRHKMVHYEAARRAQRILEQGGKRGVMEVVSYDVQHDGMTIDSILTRYTLRDNAQGMMAEMIASSEVSNMCTGVQLLPLKTPVEQCDYTIEKVRGGWLLATYGTDWPVNDTVRYAKETVGMAVYVPEQYVDTCVTDRGNVLAILRPTRYARYYLMAVGVTKAEYLRIRSKEEFFRYARKLRWF